MSRLTDIEYDSIRADKACRLKS